MRIKTVIGIGVFLVLVATLAKEMGRVAIGQPVRLERMVAELKRQHQVEGLAALEEFCRNDEVVFGSQKDLFYSCKILSGTTLIVSQFADRSGKHFLDQKRVALEAEGKTAQSQQL